MEGALDGATASGLTGRTIGQYQLGRTIGEGKFGKVKVAVHLVTGDRMAVKIISKSLTHRHSSTGKEGGEEVAKEVRCLRAINHPNVLKLHDVYEDAENLYLVLDLARGGDFFDRILDNTDPIGHFNETDARAYFLQLMRGLQACHERGIAHRDLKPENLLLRMDDTLLISDFGLSNWFSGGNEGEVMLQTPCGSTKYAAPEVIQGNLYDAKAIDVWSCGVILYIMVVGQFPWTKANRQCGIYTSFIKKDFERDPTPADGKFTWDSTLTRPLVELMTGMLTVDPAVRWTLPQILASAWCQNGVKPAAAIEELVPQQGAATANSTGTLEAPVYRDMSVDTDIDLELLESTQSNPGDECVDEPNYRSMNLEEPEALDVSPSYPAVTAAAGKGDSPLQPNVDRAEAMAKHMRVSGPAGGHNIIDLEQRAAAMRMLDEEETYAVVEASSGEMEEEAPPARMNRSGSTLKRSKSTPAFGDMKLIKQIVVELPTSVAESMQKVEQAIAVFSQKLQKCCDDPATEARIEIVYKGDYKLRVKARTPIESIGCGICFDEAHEEGQAPCTRISFSRRSGCQIWYLRFVKEMRSYLPGNADLRQSFS